MADKKLSSVSEVSDMNFVYAETAGGETVKISKADLATVVAEIIGEGTKSKVGLMPLNALHYIGNIEETPLDKIRNAFGYQTYRDGDEAGPFISFGDIAPVQIKIMYDASWFKFRILNPTTNTWSNWKSINIS